MACVTLINGTPFNWTLNTSQATGQLHSGQIVSPGASYQLEIEYNDVRFSLPDGTQVHLNMDSATKTVKVDYTNITFRSPSSSTSFSKVLTGSNNQFELILSGLGKPYFGSKPPTNWMYQVLPLMPSGATLKQFCLPKSHDSGMYKIWPESNFPGVGEANTVTQTLSFWDQLQSGVRFFDLRPGGWRGKYFALHCTYTNKNLGWKGACGDEFGAIFSQINSFTANNAELIVIEMAAGQGYRWPQYPLLNANLQSLDHLYQEQWNEIFQKIQNEVRCLFRRDPATDKIFDLTTLPISTFIGNGQAAVMFVLVDAKDNNISLGNYEGKGIFYGNNPPDHPKWALSYKDSPYFDGTNNSDADSVEQRAFRWILGFKHDSTNNQMISVSYTLTQTDTQAWSSSTGFSSSILELANSSRRKLYANLMNHCNGFYFPNLISLDNVDYNLGSLAIAITLRKCTGFAQTDLGISGPILATKNFNNQETTHYSIAGFNAAPYVACGLQSLDLYRTGMSLDTDFRLWDFSTSGFQLQILNQPSTYVTALNMNCLLFGQQSRILCYPGYISRGKQDMVIRNFGIPFPSSSPPPRIVCWIAGFVWSAYLMANCPVWRLRAYPTQIDTKGFQNVIESWDTSTSALDYAKSFAIVIPPDFKNVACGTFAVHDMRDWRNPTSSVSGRVRFIPEFPDGSEPQITTGLSLMDFDSRFNLRLRAPKITNLTSTGFNWTIETWDDTIMYDAGFSYIAWV